MFRSTTCAASATGPRLEGPRATPLVAAAAAALLTLSTAPTRVDAQGAPPPPPPPTTSEPSQTPPAPPRTPPPQRTYHCPIDGTTTVAKGTDGKETPRRYSDLEMPTQAYTNLVVVCPKCGYAAWRDDFERSPSGEVTHYAQTTLVRSAKRADTDPVAAYQHLMNVLHVQRADLREQVGAALFYTYVLKRKRPYGGLDPALERKIAAARQRVLKLLQRAMKAAAPRQARARLEWIYLSGELRRLIGDPKGAHAELELVCASRRDAGYTVGRLACEMADRAKRGDTFEDFRDGVFDVRGIEAAERDNERRRAEATARAAQAAKEAEEAAKAARARDEARRRETGTVHNGARSAPVRDGAPNAAAPPANPATPTDDPYAPPPPPVAR